VNKKKPVVPRQRAVLDVDEIIDHYLAEATEEVALGFIDELQRAYEHLAVHPGSGTLRYAVELQIPNVRAWPLARYPYLVFYLDRRDCVDVWRVLHGKRDIPRRMQAPE
jgi:toxin ParE1/3/4